MIEVNISRCSKKFRGKWVFRKKDHVFAPGHRYAIIGKNGSGKSTLLKIIAGFVSPSSGNISWSLNGNNLERASVYKHVAVSAPYMELIEEFRLPELIRFQESFKSYENNLSEYEIIRLSGLQESCNKPIKFFSSGMKQRVGLTLAILSAAPLLLLDEPCSNLDHEARHWYQTMLNEYGKGRTVIIASNHNPEEYPICDDIISL